VVFASNYMVTRHGNDVRDCFPSASLAGASFWLRKR
jgi:hypothetical protein